MKKQIKIFTLNEEDKCNEFLKTLHPDSIESIKFSITSIGHHVTGRIMVIYLTE